MKIQWDATGERYFESGVDHAILFLLDDSNKYSKGVAWNGITGVTESPSGADTTDLWADNIKYASIRAAENFGATIEAYTYPAEFEECDGSATIAKGVKIGQQSRKTFGLCYRTKVQSDVDTDGVNYKIHLIYGATASPSEKAYSTINDSPDAITFSWEVEATPVNVTGHKPTAVVTVESKDADPTKLAQLLAILEGSEEADPRMPLPDEIAELLKEAA